MTKNRCNRPIFIGFILLCNCIGFFYYIAYYKINGYLPSPFVNDKSDTFMDLFNTMQWVYNDGRYTNWGSVYPPLGFLVLKVINLLLGGSFTADAAYMRTNSLCVIFGFIVLYLISAAVTLNARCFSGFSRIEKRLVYFLIILSTPMLFALERGNLIVLAPIFLAFVFSKIGILRALNIALLINLKPYFALLMMYYFFRRNFKGFFTCTAFSGLIFCISGLFLDNDFLVFFINLLSFSGNNELFSLREVMSMPSSVSAFSYIFKHPDGFNLALNFVSSFIITIFINTIEGIKWLILFFALTIIINKSKLMRDTEILSVLIVLITNLGIWVGGYSLLLYGVIIPVVINLRAHWLYVSLLALLAMPLDIVPLMSSFIGQQYSYLSNTQVDVNWTLGLGSIIRPLINITLLLILTSEFYLRKRRVSSHQVLCGDNKLMDKR